ncbi:DUF494 family protein [Paraferrimonas sp. SM1919]|uniref:DUF494 family protein n=1 Tax=Paraferrimonas sp. SM1919 TaxID=2662263 RepID=UPI0013D061FF|nr:DUF494 family protein [Paraferrimonas sp. SM1919]
MFDILMYLFENMVHSEFELTLDHDELTEELHRAGFHQVDIIKALSWLEKLAELQEGKEATSVTRAHNHSMRIYTDDEMRHLDADCRGLLLFLEQAGILNFETREMVIERVMALEETRLDIEDLKWVVLMVLFNAPDNEVAYAHMEDLLFEQPELDRLQ